MRSEILKLCLMLALCLLFLNDCAAFVRTREVSKKYDEYSLYTKAMQSLKRNELLSFKKAKKDFQKVNDLYPFSYWGKRAQVMAAFCAYLSNDYIEAGAIASSYISTYKDGPDLAYMANLRANSYLNTIKDVDTGMEGANEAYKYFKYVIENFPDSEYSKDAKEKLKTVQDFIAAKILSIGVFYEKNAQYHSAINRFMQIAALHENTKYYDEAIFRIIESYNSLGLNQDAKKYFKILEANNPDLARLVNRTSIKQGQMFLGFS